MVLITAIAVLIVIDQPMQAAIFLVSSSQEAYAISKAFGYGLLSLVTIWILLSEMLTGIGQHTFGIGIPECPAP